MTRPDHIYSHKTIYQIHANMSSNSYFFGLADHLHSDYGTKSVRKPTFFRVCGPWARWEVALGIALVQKRSSPKLGKLWVSSRICWNLLLCEHGPKPTNYRVLGWILRFAQKPNALFLSDVQIAKGNVMQNRELGKRISSNEPEPQTRKIMGLKPNLLKFVCCVHTAWNP